MASWIPASKTHSWLAQSWERWHFAPMKSILLTLLLCCVAIVVHADPILGATEAQARARYGEPVQQFPGTAVEKVFLFRKGDVDLTLSFFRGIVGAVSYGRQDGRAWSREEAEVLMRNNAPQWVFQATTPLQGGMLVDDWKTPDGRISAVNIATRGGFLTIVTQELKDARRRSDTAALKGL